MKAPTLYNQYLTDIEPPGDKKLNHQPSAKGRNVYMNSMKKAQTQRQIDDAKSPSNQSFFTQKTEKGGKKKKINKPLHEIVGGSTKLKTLELRTGSAARFFDDEEE